MLGSFFFNSFSGKSSIQLSVVHRFFFFSICCILFSDGFLSRYRLLIEVPILWYMVPYLCAKFFYVSWVINYNFLEHFRIFDPDIQGLFINQVLLRKYFKRDDSMMLSGTDFEIVVVSVSTGGLVTVYVPKFALPYRSGPDSQLGLRFPWSTYDLIYVWYDRSAIVTIPFFLHFFARDP